MCSTTVFKNDVESGLLLLIMRMPAVNHIENVTINPIANVYFEGKCFSHSITQTDGSSISAGVILPASLNFGTAEPERMELLQGKCRIRLAGSDVWTNYEGGQSFNVVGDSNFDIEVTEALHYVCYYG